MNAEITSVDSIKAYLMAGKATVTLQSTRTGAHFTYRLRTFGDGKGASVYVLIGPDNTNDYRYVGTYFPESGYRHNRTRAQVKEDAPSIEAFAWFAYRLVHNHLNPQLKVFHEGKCGKCGRKLTTPESIETGLGPVCAGRV